MKYLLSFYLLLASFLLIGQANCKVKIPAKALSATIQKHLGRPTIFINEQPQTSVLYALTDMPGGRFSWEEIPQHNIRQFCAKGVQLYQFDISFEDIWKQDGTLDITQAQQQIRGVLKVCPSAAVIFRLHVNAPNWWLDQHPQEIVAYADTVAIPREGYGLKSPIMDDTRPMQRISLASQKWRRESSKMTELFCKKLSKTPEGKRVVGIQVACGVFGEWHYWGFSKNEPDFSLPMLEHFKSWVQKKYPNEAALQKAWKKPNIRFDSIRIPDLEARKATKGIFRDPPNEQYVIDYYRSQHELVADLIIHYCSLVKSNWPRPIIAGTFYGYFFSVFGREVAGGHLEFQKILNCPQIDYIAAPQAYYPEARSYTEVYRSRGLLHSCMLHNKLWLDEMDIEPNLSHFAYGGFDKFVSLGRAITRRNMIYSLLKGMGMWFYDYGISGLEFDNFHPKFLGVTGWWDHPDIMDDIETIQNIVQQKMDDKVPYSNDADVLFVFDTQNSYNTASLYNSNPMTELSVDWGTLAAYRSGVTFNSVHLADLKKVNWAQYKVVVFANTYKLSVPQKEFIKDSIATQNRHLIWMYAPAIEEAEGLNIDAVSAIVGMQIKETTLEDTVKTIVSKEAAQYIFQADTLLNKVSKKAYHPAFRVVDTEAVPLAFYTENQQVAAAYKKQDEYHSWYIAAPAKEGKKNILRYILNQTEAHQYTEDPQAVVYAGWGLVFYYNKFNEKGLKRSLKLKNGKIVEFTMPNIGCGVLIDAQSGAILMQAP